MSAIRRWWPLSFSLIREAVKVSDYEWRDGRIVGCVIRWDRCPPL